MKLYGDSSTTEMGVSIEISCLMGRVPRTLAGLPSLTVVLGPYGDVVVHPRANTYISWYPACMRGWTDGVSVPQEWEQACAGRIDDAEADRIAQEALSGFEEVVTGMVHAKIDVVDAGVIFSWGRQILMIQVANYMNDSISACNSTTAFSIVYRKLTRAPFSFAQQFLDCLG